MISVEHLSFSFGEN